MLTKGRCCTSLCIVNLPKGKVPKGVPEFSIPLTGHSLQKQLMSLFIKKRSSPNFSKSISTYCVKRISPTCKKTYVVVLFLLVCFFSLHCFLSHFLFKLLTFPFLIPNNFITQIQHFCNRPCLCFLL